VGYALREGVNIMYQCSKAKTKLIIAVLSVLLAGTAVQAQDVLTLGRQIKDLQQQVNDLKREVSTLRQAVGQLMKPRMGLPEERKRGTPRQAPVKKMTKAQKEAAKAEVCKAVARYVKELRSYAKMSNTDAMLRQINGAYRKMAAVLEKYRPHEVIDKILDLTSSMGLDTYEGVQARYRIEGSPSSFRRAIEGHVKQLRNLCGSSKK
jgi:regulator of replication initiation timing